MFEGNKSKDASSEEDPEEMNELYEEATMSIEELLLRYGSIKKDSEEEIEGRSKGSQLEHLMSKIRAKTQKSKSNSDGSTAQVLEPSQSDDEKPKDESDGVKCSKPQPEDHSEEKSLSVSEEESKKHDCDHKSKDKENGAKPEATHDPTEKETNSDEKVSQDNVNGTLLNGSSDHNGSSPASTTLPVKGKGKGVGKGLSNTIRKPVEKTPEELDLERKEAEKQAKRKERKESLRKKSGDELYK